MLIRQVFVGIFGGRTSWLSFQIVDRLFGDSRVKESFWQFTLDTFAPKGLNFRLIDWLVSF